LDVPADIAFDGAYPEITDSVRKLFKKHDLDPNNLRHWHVLIWEVAETLKDAPPAGYGNGALESYSN
jgi:hypothetical protein